jgi:thioredoxin-related protein
MKKTALLLIFILPSFLFAQTSSNKGIKWEEGLSWDQIKEKAKKEKKFIFVDAYATWCAPCKKMDKEVYSDNSIGELLNPQFISVRVQMDQTDNDGQQIKEWYAVAQKFNQQYSIEGYPSFLFFDSDGKLIHKGVGLKNVFSFVALVKDALRDPEARYRNTIRKYKSAELEYSAMPDLARNAWTRKDKEIAIEIAKTFKEKYVDKLSDEEAFTKPNFSLLIEFSYEVLKTNDRYFKLLFQKPNITDSILGKRNISERAVSTIITKEEIADNIYKDGKPITQPKPNWNCLHKSVLKKYGIKYYNILFPDAEIYFYNVANDWKNYIKYVNKKISKVPPKANCKLFGPAWGDEWQLNNYAWTLFQKCSDKKILGKALLWSDLAIKLESEPDTKSNYMDTKANLLYKMGKSRDAIKIEQDAISMATSKYYIDSFGKTIEKMKTGAPTWQEKNDK